jgi:hypothetical protein
MFVSRQASEGGGDLRSVAANSSVILFLSVKGIIISHIGEEVSAAVAKILMFAGAKPTLCSEKPVTDPRL